MRLRPARGAASRDAIDCHDHYHYHLLWASGREGEKARGREGERARGQEGEWASGRVGEKTSGRADERMSKRVDFGFEGGAFGGGNGSGGGSIDKDVPLAPSATLATLALVLESMVVLLSPRPSMRIGEAAASTHQYIRDRAMA